jgi:hypothetical protein
LVPGTPSPVSALVSTPSPAPTAAKDKPETSSEPKENVPKWLQVVKAVTEILAYVFAFIFFLFRTYVGYLTTNVSLSVETKRCQAKDEREKDLLVVAVTVTKKENGLLQLFLGQVRVASVTSDSSDLKALDVKRLDYDRDKVISGQSGAIKWDSYSTSYPYLQFPPGDASVFATHFLVKSGELYRIEVVIMGRGKRPKVAISQWRASCISLPTDCDGGSAVARK